ncbi:hypothetical protein ENSA5_33320 [Enhygromyxa salina]|uniref:Thioredoxin domain-containing protein n=1 Tax=Enhygromyxa salina TaxID=215803 RepID=A0A2S9XXD9_9BACT|nr:hypothetical protein [Enhygromyxa salina]PRP97535.1 hypothetical protein ENSA5_33320 [Enhygromyxa salina]
MSILIALGLVALAIATVGVSVAFRAVAGPRGSTLPAGESPSLAPRQAPAQGSSGAHVVVHLHAGAALAAQLREHANAAEARGLRPFFEFSARWCPPSRMFGELLDDPRMQAGLAGVYLIRAELDAFKDDPRTRELGTVAVPVFYELDANGQSTGRSITGAAWGADTAENMSATMAGFFAG